MIGNKWAGFLPMGSCCIVVRWSYQMLRDNEVTLAWSLQLLRTTTVEIAEGPAKTSREPQP